MKRDYWEERLKTFQTPLTEGEEASILRMLKEGDSREAKEAREILTLRNMRLVAHIAKKYQNSDEDMDDLISTGSIGLMKAIDTYDCSKGRLATYACRCIDNELLMLFRSKKKWSREVSIYEPIGQDKEGNEIQLLDVLEQEQTDVVENLERIRHLEKLYDLVEKTLTPREKTIIAWRYGLYGRTEMTQSQIGERLHISRSYVSRIEKKALLKLRKAFENKTLN